MAKPKLTPWFPKNIHPTRLGMYQVDFMPFGYAFWRGDSWSWAADTVEELLDAEYETSLNYHWPDVFKWRGLATKP